MPDTTPCRGYPFPLDTDRLDVAGDIGRLANAIDVDVCTVLTASPTGSITMFAGFALPDGWLWCDGAQVSRATYADLYTVIGIRFGAGDGTSTFNVPNMKGLTVRGQDTSRGEFSTLGQVGGTEFQSLSVSQIPAHHHNVALTTNAPGAHTHTTAEPGEAEFVLFDVPGTEFTLASASGDNNFRGDPTTGPSGDHAHSVNGDTADTGGGAVFNNMGPYMVLNYLIKV